MRKKFLHHFDDVPFTDCSQPLASRPQQAFPSVTDLLSPQPEAGETDQCVYSEGQEATSSSKKKFGFNQKTAFPDNQARFQRSWAGGAPCCFDQVLPDASFPLENSEVLTLGTSAGSGLDWLLRGAVVTSPWPALSTRVCWAWDTAQGPPKAHLQQHFTSLRSLSHLQNEESMSTRLPLPHQNA